jgi:hypothetical protein
MATKIRVKGTDPKPKVAIKHVPELELKKLPPRTPGDDRLNVRDFLTTMVGGGHKGLETEDLRNNYKALGRIVGDQTAQKLINSAALYNQRPEAQSMTPEQRVQGFYDLGSNDPEVAKHLLQGNGLGYGIAHGFRTAPLLGNLLLGKRATKEEAKTAENANKIKLIVKNTAK